MEKTTLLIVFALVLSVCTIHLPWINAISTVGDRRNEYWFWSFMQRSVHSESDSYPSYTNYKLFDKFWGSYGIGPHQSIIQNMFMIIVTGSVPYFEGGYYIILLFQLLTVLFQSICIAMNKVPLLQEFSPILLMIFYIATFIVSIGAPIVGINQYVRHWGQFVQFSLGFYLAVFSSVLTLIYALTFFVRIFRE